MSARHPARLIPVFLLVLIGVGLVQVGFLIDKTTISNITTPLKGIMKGSPYHQSSTEEAITSPHDIYKPTDWESDYFYKWGQTRAGYRWVTESRLRALAACSARGDCPANAHKIAIFATIHSHMALFDGYTGGEGTWSKGMIKSLERQGYTVLFARNNFEYVYHIYRQFPDLVKAIFVDPSGDNGQKYTDFLKKPDRLNGIPAWKFFIAYYFPNAFSSIVGNKWVLTAEPNDNNLTTYTGYEIDRSKTLKNYVPFEQRPHRVYVLAKYLHFFANHSMAAKVWDDDYYQRATDELRQRWPDFEIVGAIIDSRGEKEQKAEPWTLPPGIRNMGKLGPAEFDEALSNSRLLLGVGRPGLSPSPWRGLALGLPFLNPGDPAHKGPWQHHTVAKLGPPYSYNTQKFNYTEFVNNIAAAMETPIEPYIHPLMEAEAVDRRMHDVMTRDWRSEAAAILEERKKGNETQLFIDHPYAGGPELFEL
ncbi:uncharacterized protein LOC62_07G008871 [Vanrija pseudolonga]|uniref:Uncharacterized protein n=1 Tax=Vanrija pseudolonga TaxID=143232 RepID=A0AAF0YFG6_9TREE|nr:hypothetical protein LOC62_07G008871 [Vanrija pseudolonga]